MRLRHYDDALATFNKVISSTSPPPSMQVMNAAIASRRKCADEHLKHQFVVCTNEQWCRDCSAVLKQPIFVWNHAYQHTFRVDMGEFEVFGIDYRSPTRLPGTSSTNPSVSLEYVSPSVGWQLIAAKDLIAGEFQNLLSRNDDHVERINEQ